MANISINPLLLLIRKRCYAVAAKNAKVVAAATVARKAAGESSGTASSGDNVGAKAETFWMRDPKTGNWVPENHFADVDVVDLRHKFLSNTHNL